MRSATLVLTSCRLGALLASLTYLGAFTAALQAQDPRPVTEPTYPHTCAVYHARLATTADGPGLADGDQDRESAAETKKIEKLLKDCGNDQAVELATGDNNALSAFLINPITLPAYVSLIIDGGVTVYGSRNPAVYQVKTPTNEIVGSTCGMNGLWPINSGCNPLITLSSHTGVYGNGVIDGQGNKVLLSGVNGIHGNQATWWRLTTSKKKSPKPGTCAQPVRPSKETDADDESAAPVNVGKDANGCEQQSPLVISSPLNSSSDSSGELDSDASFSDLTLYKITIRNPPYHTTRLIADNLTVWGVKVQSPWNIPNTDGFDVSTTNATFYDDIVANGDQEIAIVSTGRSTSNMTIENFRGYGKGGITILGNGNSTSQILVENAQITGDLPSVVGTESDNPVINGVPYSELKKRYDNLASWGQALPNATNDLKALQITNQASGGSSGGKGEGAKISDVTFRSVCISDIVKPIVISLGTSSEPGYAHGIKFQDVHVLKPTDQFPSMTFGIVNETDHGTGKKAKPGRYSLYFDAPVDNNGVPANTNEITFDNLVFDDLSESRSSIGYISAIGNQFTASTNAFPAALYSLTAGSTASTTPIDGIGVYLLDNQYVPPKGGSNQYLANACHPMPFITGDLSLSTNQQSAIIQAGDSITLKAVVQPTMSQTTLYLPKSYGATPGLVSIGSPALTNAVQFYDGFMLLGSASLTANGTLASYTVHHLAPGIHFFRAVYPADRFYRSLPFGLVTVAVRPAIR